MTGELVRVPGAATRPPAAMNNERFSTPPDAYLKPLTKGQFAAVVHSCDLQKTDSGIQLYTRESHPWQYARAGDSVKVEYRFNPPLATYYVIV